MSDDAPFIDPELIATGRASTVDISALSLSRFAEHKGVAEYNVV